MAPPIQTPAFLLLRDRKPAFAEVCAQLVAGVVQGLVEGAAGRAEALGEDVDRHAVECQCDEHAPLMRRERLGNCALQGSDELALLDLRIGPDAEVRKQAPRFGLDWQLSCLPGAFA
jgi:hypothetical protein